MKYLPPITIAVLALNVLATGYLLLKIRSLTTTSEVANPAQLFCVLDKKGIIHLSEVDRVQACSPQQKQ